MLKELPPSTRTHVELDTLDGGANNERVLTWLQDKVWVVATVEGDGDLGPLHVLRVAGGTTKTSWAVSFFFLLDS
jgi:hypothetical protein